MNNLNRFSKSHEEWFYFLMNKDNPLMEFKIISDFGSYTIHEIKRFSDLLPYGFKSIHEWVINRQAPKHRKYIDRLFKLCQINNIKDFISITYGLSLNDTFWVKPKDSKLSWSQVSLYRNDFNESIAHLAFDGEGLNGLEVTTTSPEFGTDGSYAKCWIKDDNGIYLLKRGSKGFANSGLEPYSEFYTSQLAKELCESYVDYNLMNYHNELASSCRLFSDENTGYTPIVNLLGVNSTVIDIINYFDSIGSGELFRSMIVLDGISLNQDRHLKNYGVLFDNDTLEIKGMAPVFDNNMSLLPFAMNDDFNNLEGYLMDKGPKFGSNWIEIASYCLTPRLKRILKNLKGFRFSPHPEFNLPNERIDMLNKIVNSQINKILNY